jgi:tryptophanyl-tRNA synthetase
MKRLKADTAYLDGILREGARKAAALAKPVIDEVYEVVGFLRP